MTPPVSRREWFRTAGRGLALAFSAGLLGRAVNDRIRGRPPACPPGRPCARCAWRADCPGAAVPPSGAGGLRHV